MNNTSTHWQWYRKYFQMNVFRYFMLWFAIVPLFAVLLAENGNSIKLGNSPSSLIINLELPFSWELLWIASILFLIAWIIYLFCCPTFIRKYPTFTDYQNHDHDPRWIIWESALVINNTKLFQKFFERLSTKNLLEIESKKEIQLNEPIVDDYQTLIYFEKDNQLYSLGMPIYKGDVQDLNLTKISEKAIFWEIFGRFASSKTFSRFLILILIFASLILVAINIGQNIFSGFKYIFGY